MAELETALLSISQKLETPVTAHAGAKNAQDPIRLPSTPVASPVSTPATLMKHAPVLSLFDNSILSRRPDEDSGVDSHSNPKFDHTRGTLLSLFPPRETVESILRDSHVWWAGWQEIYPQIFGLEPSSNPIQYVVDSMESGSVQRIAKVLLCLLVITEERPVSLRTNHNTAIPAGQTTRALEVIDEMIISDDELAGTIDGLECMILQSKHESDNGRIRRSWLIFRRAISFAQVLGLQKQTGNSENNTNESIRRESIWKALYTADRFLSLILGLPYGPAEIHSNVGRDSESSAKGIEVQDNNEHYTFRLATIVGHIVDRNQQLPSNNMLPLTFKIEAEMMELSASMTKSWWEYGLCNQNDQVYSQLLPQFWHHQARTLLHLPFMLKATTDRRYEYNKIATLESAREMIARYRIIRPVQGFASLVCKMIDFQIFTAAMILVLNLLDHYRKDNTKDHSEADNDQDLILVTTDILQRASKETHGSVATQAARALEMFGQVKAMSSMSCPCRELGEDCATKIVIPYFGTVVIGPGTSFVEQAQTQKETPHHPQQLPTPSEQSLAGSTPKYTASHNSVITPTVPFDLINGIDTRGMGVDGNAFADVNFDLDQDWSWFWNNIDVPSMDLQGMGT